MTPSDADAVRRIACRSKILTVLTVTPNSAARSTTVSAYFADEANQLASSDHAAYVQLIGTMTARVHDPGDVVLRDFADPHRDWTPGELLALAHLWSFHTLGHVRIVRIPLGSTPGPDRARAANAAALKAGLPPDLHLTSFQAGWDGDGVITSDDDMVTFGFPEHNLGEPAPPAPGSPTRPLMPQLVPSAGRGIALEVGSTNASRTWEHLQLEGAVWRWPYGSPDLILFATPDLTGIFARRWRDPNYWEDRPSSNR